MKSQAYTTMNKMFCQGDRYNIRWKVYIAQYIKPYTPYHETSDVLAEAMNILSHKSDIRDNSKLKIPSRL